MLNQKVSLTQVAVLACAAGIAYRLWPRTQEDKAGQVAVITGGSRGLGKALAHRFARAGMRLVLAAERQEELEQARGELLAAGVVTRQEDISIFACDLSQREGAEQLIRLTLDRFGRLDVLVNNAGIIEVGPAENQPMEAYERAIAVDYLAAVYTTYAALPYFFGCGRGAIVNISSIGGKFAVPHLLPYVAAKFALTGFSEGLHAELRHKGIRVTTVCPGLMRTGGEAHAHFRGQIEKEKAWFQWSARTPLISTRVNHAADRIFAAYRDQKTELIISPQAWLAARFSGLAPQTTQAISAVVNQYFLPAPAVTPESTGGAI